VKQFSHSTHSLLNRVLKWDYLLLSVSHEKAAGVNPQSLTFSLTGDAGRIKETYS